MSTGKGKCGNLRLLLLKLSVSASGLTESKGEMAEITALLTRQPGPVRSLL